MKFLKNPKLQYVPWTGLGMALGMWIGTILGRRINPEEYLIYGACGLGAGLIFGNAFERAIKAGESKKRVPISRKTHRRVE